MKLIVQQTAKLVVKSIAIALTSVSAFAADRIEGRVEGAGEPIAKAEVTLWLAGAGAPQKLAETKTNNDGDFGLTIGAESDGGVL